MKTKLPAKIASLTEAEMFLEQLYINNESFHPEDDAFEIVWRGKTPSKKELKQLNNLMADIYNLPETESGKFDPCGFLLDIEYNYMFAIYMTNSATELEQLKADTNKAGTLSSMQYHTSWEWLMPVLNKISSLNTVHLAMDAECRCTIKTYSVSGGRNQIWAAENTCPSLIDAAFHTALEYIQMTLNIYKQ